MIAVRSHSESMYGIGRISQQRHGDSVLKYSLCLSVHCFAPFRTRPSVGFLRMCLPQDVYDLPLAVVLR